MIDPSDVQIDGDSKGIKAQWNRATHMPTGVVIEGDFKSGKELLEKLDKAVTSQAKSKS